MRIADIDHIRTDLADLSRPVVIEQSAARLAACSLLTVSGLAMAAMLAPVGIIATHAANDPAALAGFADRPFSTAILTTGFALAVSLIAIPLRAGLGRLSRRATVTLSATHADVVEHGLLGTSRWTAPLSDFKGVAHHVRATLSGARHEIVLVHADADRDVLLQLTPRAPEHDADHFARLLGTREIHPRELYGRSRALAFWPQTQPAMSPVAA